MAQGKRVRRRRRRRSALGGRLLGLLILVALVVLALWGCHALGGRDREEEAESDGEEATVVTSALASDSVLESDVESSSEPTAEPSSESEPEGEQEPETEPEAKPQPGSARAKEVLAGMTLREKVCQMIMAQPSKLTGVSQVTAAGETTRKALERYPVGAIMYDTANMQSQEQVRAMLQTTQSFSKIPLLLTCDEEGGRVGRLMKTVGTTRLEPMFTYKDQGPEKAKANARTLAKDLRSCGMNLDLAPVADVWTNPNNTVIGDRAYSDDYQQAAQLIPAAVAGFHQENVACVIKHFPGHGSTTGDSHYGSAYVNKTLDQLRREDLIPFQAGIDAGADMVMMGHLIVPDIDPQPAVLSRKIVTGLLREEMGFDGVIITDALAMQAITDHYGKNEVVLKAVQAGVDMLLSPTDLDGAVNTLMKAVENGTISEERIDQSVLRILTLKERYGLL